MLRRDEKGLAMSARTDKPMARRGIPPSPFQFSSTVSVDKLNTKFYPWQYNVACLIKLSLETVFGAGSVRTNQHAGR